MYMQKCFQKGSPVVKIIVSVLMQKLRSSCSTRQKLYERTKTTQIKTKQTADVLQIEFMHYRFCRVWS